jgi:hypothetical protein
MEKEMIVEKLFAEDTKKWIGNKLLKWHFVWKLHPKMLLLSTIQGV